MPVAFVLVSTMTIALLWYLLRVRKLHGFIDPMIVVLLILAGLAFAFYAFAGATRHG